MRLDNMTKMYFNGKECGAAYFNGQKIWGISILQPEPEQSIKPEDFKSLLLYVGTAYVNNWQGLDGIPYTDEQINRIATELGNTRVVINTNASVARWLFNGVSPFNLNDINNNTWKNYVGAQGFSGTNGMQTINSSRFSDTSGYPVQEAYSYYIPYAITLAKKLVSKNPNIKVWLTFPIGVDYFTSLAHYSKEVLNEVYNYFKTQLYDIWDNIEGFYYGCEAGLTYWENGYPTNGSLELLQYLKNNVLEGQKLMWIPYQTGGTLTATQANRQRILNVCESGLVDYMCIPSGYIFNPNNDTLSNCQWIVDHIEDYDNFGYEVEWDSKKDITNYNKTLTYFNQCKGKGPMCFYIGARPWNNYNNYNFDNDLNIVKDFLDL